MEGIYRFQFLPAATRPALLARVAAEMLRFQPFFHFSYSRPWTDHAAMERDPFQGRAQFSRVMPLRPTTHEAPRRAPG
jgi:hypothetical protein